MCSQQYKVPYGDFQKSGYPKIVCFTKENPNLNWMIWGYPHFRKPPYSLGSPSGPLGWWLAIYPCKMAMQILFLMLRFSCHVFHGRAMVKSRSRLVGLSIKRHRHRSINILLVGGDWNHGILNDFPFSWELNNHPNWLSLHDFSEGWLNHQSVLILYIKSRLQWWGDHNPSLPCFVRWHGYCSIGVSGELSILQTSVDWVAQSAAYCCDTPWREVGRLLCTSWT